MRNINLTADHLDTLASGSPVDVSDQHGKRAQVDGRDLSTSQISALCEGGRVFTKSVDGAEVVLLGVEL